MKIITLLTAMSLISGCLEKAPRGTGDRAPEADGNEGFGGMGGDETKLRFSNNRSPAASLVRRVKSYSFGSDVEEADIEWILNHREKLANDILHSDHHWITEKNEKGYCGETQGIELATITFSFPSCERHTNTRNIQGVLIHESIHHLGIADESRTDTITTAILEANVSGGVGDWKNLSPNNYPEHEGTTPPATAFGEEKLFVWGVTPERSTHFCSQPSSSSYYDLAAKKWRRMNPEHELGYRSQPAITYFNGKLLIWGGLCNTDSGETSLIGNGAIYRTADDSWEDFSTNDPDDANEPQARHGAQFAVTDHGPVLWGGSGEDGPLLDLHLLQDSSSWKKILLPENLTLDAREIVQKVFWTGDSSDDPTWNKRLVLLTIPKILTGLENIDVWTLDLSNLDTGEPQWERRCSGPAPYNFGVTRSRIYAENSQIVIYDPNHISVENGTISGIVWNTSNNTWAQMPISEAPGKRYDEASVWTGTELIVWGGIEKIISQPTATGSIYNLEHNTWRPMTTANSITPRQSPQAHWSGSEMIIWGGAGMGVGRSLANFKDGGIFVP